MPSSHLVLCRPLLFLPPIPPSIRVFSNESALPIRWPKYWSFSFNISPSNEHPGLISFRMDWLDHLAVQGVTYVFWNFRASYKFQNHQNRPSRFTDEETGRQSCVRIVSKMLSSSCVLDGCQICLSKVNSQQIASLLEIFQMAIPHQMTADCAPSTQPCPFWLLLMPLPNVPLTGLLCGWTPPSYHTGGGEGPIAWHVHHLNTSFNIQFRSQLQRAEEIPFPRFLQCFLTSLSPTITVWYPKVALSICDAFSTHLSQSLRLPDALFTWESPH